MTVGSSVSDFAFNSERKCHTHLSWMRSASRSSSLSSYRTYYEILFLTSSTSVDLRRWNSPRWSRLFSFSSIAVCLDTSATRSSASVWESLVHTSPTLALRYHLFSGAHDGLSEGRFHLVDIASAKGVRPEAVPSSQSHRLPFFGGHDRSSNAAGRWGIGWRDGWRCIVTFRTNL